MREVGLHFGIVRKLLGQKKVTPKEVIAEVKEPVQEEVNPPKESEPEMEIRLKNEHRHLVDNYLASLDPPLDPGEARDLSAYADIKFFLGIHEKTLANSGSEIYSRRRDIRDELTPQLRVSMNKEMADYWWIHAQRMFESRSDSAVWQKAALAISSQTRVLIGLDRGTEPWDTQKLEEMMTDQGNS